MADRISFHIEIVQPGQTHRFAPDQEVMRVCSLASGKLRVRVKGEPEFVIGPRGMFKLKPGVACAVENRLYLDSVLHISSLTLA